MPKNGPQHAAAVIFKKKIGLIFSRIYDHLEYLTCHIFEKFLLHFSENETIWLNRLVQKCASDFFSLLLLLMWKPTRDLSVIFLSLFRNKMFMLDEMTYWKASKFAIFLEYENSCSFIPFSFCATLNAPWSFQHNRV